MTTRTTSLAQAIGLTLLVSATAPLAADEVSAPSRRKPARVFTNADLERVHPFVSETGVASTPSVPPEDVPRPAAGEDRPAGRGETYWRGEAARVRERLRALEQRAAVIRGQIQERARRPEVFGRGQAASNARDTTSLEAALAAVEQRMKRTEDDLEERARRDGALPGWLR